MKKVFLILFFAPLAVFSQSNPEITYTQTCYGNQTTLVASSSLPDTSIASWMWDTDNNGSYDITGKKIIWLFIQNDSVRLKIIPKTGISDSTVKFVAIDPLPQVNFISSNLCELRSAAYISQSAISAGSINQYLWDFNNDGITDDNSNDTVNYTCGPAQTYVTKLSCVSDKGCAAFTQKITTVYPNPSASFSASAACQGDTTLFTNTTTVPNPDFYLWDFGDGNQATSTGNVNHIYAASGNMNVTMIAVSKAGCRDTATSTITIYAPPIANFTSLSSCFGSQAVFADGSTIAGGDPISIWNWNFGDSASTNNTSTSQNATHTFLMSGSFLVSLSITSTFGCMDIVSKSVSVFPIPVVSITSSSTVLQNGGNVTLIASGASNYTWNTGVNSASITTDSIGTYIVTGTDANECMASDTIIITSENAGEVSVSGFILTPNEDNINDALWINNISAYSGCDLNVYNMWNDGVYSVKGYKNDWKGTNADGAKLPAGAYYYIIQCDDMPMLKGNINILH